LSNLKILQLQSEKARKDIQIFNQTWENEGYCKSAYTLLEDLGATNESNYFISANVNKQFLAQL